MAPASWSLEKKPLNHFLPGTRVVAWERRAATWAVFAKTHISKSHQDQVNALMRPAVFGTGAEPWLRFDRVHFTTNRPSGASTFY
jgi:hypothetical protein